MSFEKLGQLKRELAIKVLETGGELHQRRHRRIRNGRAYKVARVAN